MSEEKENETIAETVEKVAEEAVEVVEDAIENSVPFLLKLKNENPALFFGGIAGVIVTIVLFMLAGDEGVSQQKQTAISLGNTYTLQAPNSLGAIDISLKILKIPGQMSAFDNDDDVTCNAPVGTSVTARGFQDAFGTAQMFVQVEINQEVGDCRQGVKGWTLKNNLK